jgi:hypothetical protein
LGEKLLVRDTAGVVTVIVLAALALPPDPLQATVYVCCPADNGVTPCVPLVASGPFHAPLAVHDVALVDDHVRVTL